MKTTVNKVINPKAVLTAIHDENSLIRGWWIADTGERYHAAYDTSWKFMHGEKAEGRIVNITFWTPSDRDNEYHTGTYFEIDQEKYRMPDFYHDAFEKRKVILDLKVRGSFISNCKLCGAKKVNEIEHVRMTDCFTKNKVAFKKIQKVQNDFLNQFRTNKVKLEDVR